MQEIVATPITAEQEEAIEADRKSQIESIEKKNDFTNLPYSRPTKPEPKKIIVKQIEELWKNFSERPLAPKLKGKIVIIIDDMGIAQKLSYEALALPGPLTLSFLPYAQSLKKMTRKAQKNGHELMIHMPMEPVNPKLDVGAIALLDNMEEAEIRHALTQAFKSFDGYVGINNHMGSKVTQNTKIMNIVMETLSQKDLLFVDSKTINTSVAADVASRHGLNYAQRDVFLDHYETDEFVRQSLRRVEEVAHKKGYAIAIGHPKAITIKGLKEWIPTLKEKGFEIVPISAVVKNDRIKNARMKEAEIQKEIKLSAQKTLISAPAQ